MRLSLWGYPDEIDKREGRSFGCGPSSVYHLLRRSGRSPALPYPPSRRRRFYPIEGRIRHKISFRFLLDATRVVAFVNERRTDAACRQLLQKLSGCQITRYHIDNWQPYAKLLPTRRNRTGKEDTSRIERHNLNFRTRLKRLQRHTICYSKSAVMHDAVIKLYTHHSNAGHHHF